MSLTNYMELKRFKMCELLCIDEKAKDNVEVASGGDNSQE